MLERVPCEPAQLERRRVTLFERGVAVRVFVRNHGEQQNGRNEEDILEGVHVRKKVLLYTTEVKVLP